MNRHEFLDRLAAELGGAPAGKIADIRADYAAYFDEGARAGRSEAEVAEGLGDPSRIGRDLRAELAEELDDPSLASPEPATLPMICYILYLVGLTHGVTAVIAVVLAYAQRSRSGPVAASHYDWIIRTFWLSLGALALTAVMVVGGIVLTQPTHGASLGLFVAGLVLTAATLVWNLVRCILGLVRLSHHESYPRPDALLI